MLVGLIHAALFKSIVRYIGDAWRDDLASTPSASIYCRTQIQGGVALRFARVKRYRPDKDAGEADTIDDLRALLPARAGDEFHASGSSKEVLNRKDEHPEEER